LKQCLRELGLQNLITQPALAEVAVGSFLQKLRSFITTQVPGN